MAVPLPTPSIAVVLTCHNRVETTLRCLAAVHQQRLEKRLRTTVYVVDAGSSDGTAGRIIDNWPQTVIIQVDDTFFWSMGMRLGFATAIHEGFDYYLWLNDDTVLYPDALERLLATANQLDPNRERAIVVGVTRDPRTGAVSYGGWISKSRWNRLKIVRMNASAVVQRCDTMNGNCVLIPNAVVKKIGNLDKSFTHGMGDLDYGLRANDAGHATWVSPGFIGECARNSGTGLWTDKSLPVTERMRRMLGPKGLPIREWFVFTRRYAGPFWMLHWLSPYVKTLLTSSWGHEPSPRHQSSFD